MKKEHNFNVTIRTDVNIENETLRKITYDALTFYFEENFIEHASSVIYGINTSTAREIKNSEIKVDGYSLNVKNGILNWEKK